MNSFAFKEGADSTQAPKKFKNVFFLAPSFYYLPETSFAFGVTGKIIFKFKGADSATRASVIYPPIYYTLNNQLLFQTYYTLFLNKEKWIINGSFNYLKYPQKYFEAGDHTLYIRNENFSYNLFKSETVLLRKIKGKLFAGLGYRFQEIFDVKTVENGILETEKPVGYHGGKCSGLIADIAYDNRDNLTFPTHGEFFEGIYRDHLIILGSDYNYQTLEINLRKYINLFHKKSHVLALQLYGYFSQGNVFVKDMAELGSEFMMRGYYQGRFRDFNQLVTQFEYRFPIWKRFSMVTFAGMGNVAHKISLFNISSLKYSCGAGIRFAINRKENLNIRIDFALTPESSSFYSGTSEVF